MFYPYSPIRQVDLCQLSMNGGANYAAQHFSAQLVVSAPLSADNKSQATAPLGVHMEFKSKEQNPNLDEVFDVDPKEVNDLHEQISIIDVRRPDEYTGELGHIAGSRLITLDTLSHHIQSLQKDKPIVFVCRSGARSANAASMAVSYGYDKVYNMKGGMIAWNEYGLDVEY